MRELTIDEMAGIVGGQRIGNGWCFAAGVVTGLAIATGPLGLVVYGPSAIGLGAACLFGSS